MQKISKAYGFNYSEIKKNNEIEKTLKKVLKSNKPEFINVYLNPNQKIIPKLSFGDPIEDLSPRLNRNEFYENMIIDPLKKVNLKKACNFLFVQRKSIQNLNGLKISFCLIFLLFIYQLYLTYLLYDPSVFLQEMA